MTEEISNVVIGCASRVHSAFGSGLRESSDAAWLHYELMQAGLFAEAQEPLPLVYNTVEIEPGYRVDLMEQRKLIVEAKPVECLNDIQLAQSNVSESVELSTRALDELLTSSDLRTESSASQITCGPLAAVRANLCVLYV